MAKNTGADGACLRLDKPEHAVGFLLKSLHHAIRQTFESALRAEGIEMSFAHFAALYGLQCEPGSTGASLARRATVSAQTMNAVLRRLELDGRIERRPHPESRRADSWSLTPEGLAALDAARKVGVAVFSRMLAPLSRDEIAGLESALRRCIGALEAPTPDGAEGAPPKRRAISAARMRV